MSARQIGAAARELQRLILGPRPTLVPGVHHYLPIETPEAFVAQLESFLPGAAER